jgi:hypothetical protein
MDLGMGVAHLRRRAENPAAAAEGILHLLQRYAVAAVAGRRMLLFGGGDRLLDRLDSRGIGLGTVPQAQPAMADDATGERGGEVIERFAAILLIELADDVLQRLAAEIVQRGILGGLGQGGHDAAEMGDLGGAFDRLAGLLAHHALGHHHDVGAAQAGTGEQAVLEQQVGSGEVGGGGQRDQLAERGQDADMMALHHPAGDADRAQGGGQDGIRALRIDALDHCCGAVAGPHHLIALQGDLRHVRQRGEQLMRIGRWCGGISCTQAAGERRDEHEEDKGRSSQRQHTVLAHRFVPRRHQGVRDR